MKSVPVEYLESGSFQGSEELAFDAGIKRGDICVVIHQSDYTRLIRAFEALEYIEGMCPKPTHELGDSSDYGHGEDWAEAYAEHQLGDVGDIARDALKKSSVED